MASSSSGPGRPRILRGNDGRWYATGPGRARREGAESDLEQIERILSETTRPLVECLPTQVLSRSPGEIELLADWAASLRPDLLKRYWPGLLAQALVDIVPVGSGDLAGFIRFVHVLADVLVVKPEEEPPP